jgi:hypothetical protein
MEIKQCGNENNDTKRKIIAGLIDDHTLQILTRNLTRKWRYRSLNRLKQGINK